MEKCHVWFPESGAAQGTDQSSPNSRICQPPPHSLPRVPPPLFRQESGIHHLTRLTTSLWIQAACVCIALYTINHHNNSRQEIVRMCMLRTEKAGSGHKRGGSSQLRRRGCHLALSLSQVTRLLGLDTEILYTNLVIACQLNCQLPDDPQLLLKNIPQKAVRGGANADVLRMKCNFAHDEL